MLQGCSRRARLRSRTLVVALMVWLGCAGSAAAETKTWVGGGGSWHTAANWSPAGVPLATDDALIDAGVPEVSAADATVGSIDVRSGIGVSGDRTLTVAGTAPSTIAATAAVVPRHAAVERGHDVVGGAGADPRRGRVGERGCVAGDGFGRGRCL